MRNRGIRLAYGVLIVYAALAAFLFVRGLDDSGVLGADYLVLVQGSQTGSTPEQVTELVNGVAESTGANIGRTIDDLRDPGRLRHIYLAVGNPDGTAASWLDQGYRWFSRDARTDVHPISEAQYLDPRGYYVVFGDASAVQALTRGFQSLGYETRSRLYYDPASIGGWLANQPLGLSAVVVALLIALTVAASVLSNGKGYGVQRLQGAAWARTLVRDLRQVAVFAGAAVAAVVILSAALLWFYNGLHQWTTYLAVGAVVVAALVLVAILAHLIALGLAQGLPILESIKGRIPFRGATFAVYAVRVPAIFVAGSAVVTAAVTAGQVVNYQTSLSAWQRAGDAVYVNFNASLDPAETDRLAAQAGRWLMEAERSGEMVLAHKDRLDLMAGGPPADVMLVNENYLKRQEVLTAAGQRLTSVPPATVLVLVPQELSALREAVEDAVAQWVSANGRMSSAGGAPAEVRTVVTPAGQSYFTYGNPTTPDPSALVSRAVLVALNADSRVISADSYMAYASQGGALLTDQEHAIATARAAGLATFISGFRPAAQQAASRHAELLRDLRVHLFNIAAVLAVLLATAVGLAQIYTRKNAQALFVKYVSGWPFLQTHPWLLLGEAVLGIAVVAWSLWSTASALLASRPVNGVTPPPDPAEVYLLGGWRPLVMLALVALNLAFLVLALRILTRRLVHTRSAEA